MTDKMNDKFDDRDFVIPNDGAVTPRSPWGRSFSSLSTTGDDTLLDDYGSDFEREQDALAHLIWAVQPAGADDLVRLRKGASEELRRANEKITFFAAAVVGVRRDLERSAVVTRMHLLLQTFAAFAAFDLAHCDGIGIGQELLSAFVAFTEEHGRITGLRFGDALPHTADMLRGAVASSEISMLSAGAPTVRAVYDGVAALFAVLRAAARREVVDAVADFACADVASRATWKRPGGL